MTYPGLQQPVISAAQQAKTRLTASALSTLHQMQGILQLQNGLQVNGGAFDVESMLAT